MKKNFNFTILLLILLPIVASAQTNKPTSDLSGRFGLHINGELYKGLSLKWSEEARLKQLSTRFDQLHSILSLNYKVNNYFKTGIAYTLILTDKLATKHRGHLDLIGNYKIDRWQLSLRERPEFTLSNKNDTKWILRSKLQLDYSAKTAPITPSLSFELTNTLNDAQKQYIEKLRTELNLKWKINKLNQFDFYYRFDINFNPPYSDDILIKKYTHIIGIFYTLNLYRKNN
ncbi:MAG: DUF2490 domain-containing protein [Paludibacteraceae bacterium]|nr:DUF2490 domain-containing protein [Paludibacteraceae bacterium]